MLSITELIPSFELQAINQDVLISPWHYKQRYSLVIFFFHGIRCEACQTLILNLAQQHSEYRACETEILAISTCRDGDEGGRIHDFSTENGIPFPMLWDSLGQVSQAYVGDIDGRSPVGIFLCDRFGELHMQAIADEATELPGESDIRDWAEFVDMNCPECFPPTWR